MLTNPAFKPDVEIYPAEPRPADVEYILRRVALSILLKYPDVPKPLTVDVKLLSKTNVPLLK